MAIGTPTTCDIERRRGDTKDLRIRLTDSGTAIDVTSFSGIITLDPSPAPDDALNNVFTTTGAPTGTPTDGILVFDMVAFTAVSPGVFFYDVQITDAAGEISTLLIGKFTVKQDITK